MRSDPTLTGNDEGKRVVDASGDEIGRVVQVERGTAHVDPDPGLADAILARLGWGEGDEDTYRLDADQIGTVTDDEVRLEG